MQSPWIIGLTGGIGSGKSAAAHAFAKLGIEVVDSDQASRWVVEPGQPALQAIHQHSGDEVLYAEGSLNRAALRELIFAESEQREWLEQLLHPLIRQAVDERLAQAKSPYSLLVSPLLIESGQYQRVQRLIVVGTPVELQIERTLSRDSVSMQQVQRIIATQMTRADRLAYADDVLTNNGTLNELEAQVLALHQQYLRLLEIQHDT